MHFVMGLVLQYERLINGLNSTLYNLNLYLFVSEEEGREYYWTVINVLKETYFIVFLDAYKSQESQEAKMP